MAAGPVASVAEILETRAQTNQIDYAADIRELETRVLRCVDWIDSKLHDLAP